MLKRFPNYILSCFFSYSFFDEMEVFYSMVIDLVVGMAEAISSS